MVSPCASSNLGTEAKGSGSAITAAVEWKENNYQGTFFATYTLCPLAVSICGAFGSNTQAFIKTIAVRRVDLQDNMPTSRASAAAEG